MIDTFPQTIPEMKIEEIKSIKYKNALKLIESALNEWGFDTAINSDPSFPYYVSGIIDAVRDWSDEE